MSRSHESPVQPATHILALIGIALGGCGLLLAFLPILATPLSVIGLVAAGTSLVYSYVKWPNDLRWPAMSLSLCLTAVAVDLLIAYMPLGFTEQRAIHRPHEAPVKAYVAPPANVNWLEDSADTGEKGLGH